MHVLTKEGVVQLSRLDREIREGATASPDAIRKVFPGLETGSQRAIETEMHLLSAMRGRQVDPYLGYRLGLLGGVVAGVTAPLATEAAGVRNRYYDDVDRNIGQVTLKYGVRKFVDPEVYFTRVRQLAEARTPLIIKDYQEGLGFEGVAKAMLPEGSSRSVDAVADVWATILTGTAVNVGISQAQTFDFIVNAMAYYVGRGNLKEIDGNYARLTEQVTVTPDLAKRIGDMFYDAGFYERAIEEYQIVLAANPSERDVTRRIADYYVKVGEEAVTAGRLQQAYEAFAKAAQADPLHSNAEARRLEVQSLIAQRDARLESARKLIEEAAQYQTQAEQLGMQRKHTEAMDLLKKAGACYEEITDEFPTEYQAAHAGLTNVEIRIREMKTALIENAQDLTGTSLGREVRLLAAGQAAKVDEQALRALASKQLDKELIALRQQYKAVLPATP